MLLPALTGRVSGDDTAAESPVSRVRRRIVANAID
jgi:hypothetical protein